MKILLKKVSVLLTTRLEPIRHRRRIAQLRNEGEDIFQEAMGRITCQKPTGGGLNRDQIDDEIYSV